MTLFFILFIVEVVFVCALFCLLTNFLLLFLLFLSFFFLCFPVVVSGDFGWVVCFGFVMIATVSKVKIK